MAKHQKLEKWAKPILIKYQKLLLLTDHKLTFEYSKDVEDSTSMHHLYRYPYKETVIQYGKSAIESFDKKEFDDLKHILVHELCHSLTDPLYSKAVNRYVSKDEILDEREALTDHIANIIYNFKVI